MARTAAQKRVRTEYLKGSISEVTGALVPDSTEFQDQLLDSFTPQMDIRVIGWHLESEITLPSGAAPDTQSKTRCAVFLARGAPQDYDNRWAVLHSTAGNFSTTANTSPGTPHHVHEDVMFPEGHGFDVDEGEAVYLYGTIRNYIGDDVDFTGTCVLYYVPRQG